MNLALLSRTEFRDSVLARRGGLCAICDEKAVDAHHIIERRLFDDGGYYFDNGAPVCAGHHLAAERTLISAQDLRDALGITKIVLPPQLPPDETYDKWGNVIHEDGTRSPGELFWDESVQKVLREGCGLHTFRTKMKYPKTPHLPSSPGRQNDDSLIDPRDLASWAGEPILVTEKMDGENTTFYTDYLHARSLDSMGHPSQDYVKRIHSEIAHDIPLGWRVVGENMYAVHSVTYEDLRSYFLVFAIFDENGTLLPWGEITEWCRLLELATVPVIDFGPFQTLENAHDNYMDYASSLNRESEGYVVRLADAIRPENFRRSIAKWVRPNHVQTIPHGWRYRNDFKVNELNGEVMNTSGL